MIFKKRKNKIPELNYLELIPFRMHESEIVNGITNILIPKFKSQFFQNLIPKNKSKYLRVKLDEIGSSVWEAVDGKKDVNGIVNELSEKFGDRIQPAAERITKFFTQLLNSNFINFKQLKRRKNG